MAGDRGSARAVLVTGFPRSGTTWVAEALSRGLGIPYRHEPDNEKLHVAALAAKRGLGRYPALAKNDSAPAFDRLWQQSFGSAPGLLTRAADKAYATWFDTDIESGRTAWPLRATATAFLLRRRMQSVTCGVVVKSVHIPLCLEHVAGLVDARVVAVTRDPRNVLASWLELAMPDADRRLDERSDVRSLYLDPWGLPRPSPRADAFERAAWHCALFSWAVRHAISRNPGWVTVEHESLAERGVSGFRSLAGALGESWRQPGTDYVRAGETQGSGYETKRDPAALRNRWQRTLTEEQVETAQAVFTRFSL